MPKNVVAVVGLILLSAILVLLDLNVSVYADPHSWTQFIRNGFRTQPAVAWVVGVIMGHLYHPFGRAPFRQTLPLPLNRIVDPLGDTPIVRILVAVLASTGIVVLLALVFKLASLHPPVWPFGIVGMVFGAFMWPTSASSES